MARSGAKTQPSSNLEAALELVTRIETRYRIDTGIGWAACAPLSEHLSYDGAMWDFPIFGGTMYVAPGLRGRALREVVYHEMGHAIASAYDISPFLGVFTRRNASMGFWEWWNYGKDGARFAAQPRTTGFVSGYARTTREEDFCETLSCFLVNGGRTSGMVSYAGARFDVSRDPRVKRKLRAIPEILEACAEAEKA